MNKKLNNMFIALYVGILATWELPLWDLINFTFIRIVAGVCVVIVIVYMLRLRTIMYKNPQDTLNLVMNLPKLMSPVWLLLTIYWVVDVARLLPAWVNYGGLGLTIVSVVVSSIINYMTRTAMSDE